MNILERNRAENVSQGKISVLIADDHRLLAETLEAYLLADGGFAVDRAETFDEALAAISAAGGYDVVLLDLGMPGMPHFAGIEQAITANNRGKVVLFSGRAGEEVALRAIEVGGAGFIPKSLSVSSFAAVIRFIAAGETYLPPFFARSRVNMPGSAERLTLSNRELEILRRICRGQKNKDIAAELDLTEVTVKAYVRSLCTKLNASNRTQAATMALASGIV